MRTVALLLAAGNSSRMGEEKLFLPWASCTVLRATAEKIAAAGFSEVIVVAGANEAKVRAALGGLDLKIIANPHAALGMHSSIRAGLAAAGAPAAFAVCLADQPTVPTTLYRRLLDELGEAPLAAPFFEGSRGNPVVIAGRLIPEIFAHEDDDRGCAYLFKRHEAKIIAVADPSVLQDLDTPEDYARLKPPGIS